MLSIKCENCGANISFEEDKLPGFCTFCGSSMTITKEMLIELKKAEKNSKAREHEKKMAKYSIFKSVVHNTPTIIVLIMCLVMLVVILICMFSSFKS